MERLVCRRAALSNLGTASARQQSWTHTSTTRSRRANPIRTDTEERTVVRKFFAYRKNAPTTKVGDRQETDDKRVRRDVYQRESLKGTRALQTNNNTRDMKGRRTPRVNKDMQDMQEPEVLLTSQEVLLTKRRQHFKAIHEPSYVVTLSVTTLLHKTLSKLRNDHYPSSLNFEAGHIILFPELPASHLSHIALDLNQVINTRSSFPIRIRETPHRTRERLYLRIAEGEDKVKQLWKQLADRWRETLPTSIPEAKEYEPSVVVLDHTAPEERVEAFKRLTWQLGKLSKPTSAYDIEAGTLSGVCTGVNLFARRESQRLEFKRRFVFLDVPTTGWNTPENLNIPATSGNTGSPRFAEFPSRARES